MFPNLGEKGDPQQTGEAFSNLPRVLSPGFCQASSEWLVWDSDSQCSLDSSRELLKMPGSHSQAFDILSVGAGPRNYHIYIESSEIFLICSQNWEPLWYTLPLLRTMARITAVWSTQEWLRLLCCFGEKRKKKRLRATDQPPVWNQGGLSDVRSLELCVCLSTGRLVGTGGP